MSAREWKPGDVALRRADGEDSLAVASGRCDRHSVTGPHWHYADGGWDYLDSNTFSTFRPVVVIDPEDREAVERLIRALDTVVDGCPMDSIHPDRLRNFTAALREFANPTPPKPEEPTGLGAVVEDESQVEHIHLGSGLWAYGTTDGPSKGHAYADIAAVRVLSEGVTQ